MCLLVGFYFNSVSNYMFGVSVGEVILSSKSANHSQRVEFGCDRSAHVCCLNHKILGNIHARWLPAWVVFKNLHPIVT